MFLCSHPGQPAHAANASWSWRDLTPPGSRVDLKVEPGPPIGPAIGSTGAETSSSAASNQFDPKVPPRCWPLGASCWSLAWDASAGCSTGSTCCSPPPTRPDPDCPCCQKVASTFPASAQSFVVQTRPCAASSIHHLPRPLQSSST